MLVYRDRTYCICSECHRMKCDRRITTDVVYAAELAGLDIAISDFSEHCGDYLNTGDICFDCKHFKGGGDFGTCCTKTYGLRYWDSGACEYFERGMSDVVL